MSSFGWCCSEGDDGDADEKKTRDGESAGLKDTGAAPPEPHTMRHRNNEDDMQAIRSWRERHYVGDFVAASSAIALQIEPISSSPSKSDTERNEPTSAEIHGLQKQQFAEPQDRNNERGEFPSFTKEEQEELRQKQLMKDDYLSSSSTSSADDPIFQRSPVSNDEDDELNEARDLNEPTVSRPGTDEGEGQPVSPLHYDPFVVSDLQLPDAATATTQTSQRTASPTPISEFLIGNRPAVESDELDAIVAAIDQTRQHQSPKGLTSRHIPSQRSLFAPDDITAQAQPVQRLFPSPRDSPSVNNRTSYRGERSSPTLVTPLSSGSKYDGTSVSPIPPKSPAHQRRRERSRSWGRTSPSEGKQRPNFNMRLPDKQSRVSFSPVISGSGEPSMSPPRFSYDDEDDRLSDVPSDVASDVKERYLLACRILKSALIEKDSTLQPSEKNFLASLLHEKSQIEEAPTEAHVTVIESAAETLRSIPTVEATASDPRFAVTGRKSDSANKESIRSRDSESPEASGISEKTLQMHNKRIPDDEDIRRKSPYSQASSSLFSRVEDYPFKILGTEGFQPTVLTPTVMEGLRGFFPYSVAEENFLLKFAIERDGSALLTLLAKVRSSKHTIISVETVDGYVFGAFCSSPWRARSSWFGSGESFLWRLKKPRMNSNNKTYDNDSDNEIEIYPYTGHDELIQYCTTQALAVGGGTDWADVDGGSPYLDEPSGIGFLIDGDLMGGETSSCVTFANPRLGDRFGRTTEFEIQALEAWTVTPCLTVEEAEEIEMRKFFLEELASGR